MTTFSNPTFTADYQSLCNYIATTLNRQDLTTDIPNFVSLATSRIQRDIARSRHPAGITKLSLSLTAEYSDLPADFLSVYQLSETAANNLLIYLSPDQLTSVNASGWDALTSPTPYLPPYYTPIGNFTYYTIIGNQLRVLPAPTVANPAALDLWYYAKLTALSTTSTTNWVLTKYPDLYLYGSLVHTAPYLKNDERIALWDGLYKSILTDIEMEAERATRPQSKLVANRRSF